MLNVSRLLVSFFLLFYLSSSQAAFVLDRTRYIATENGENSMIVTNSSSQTYGGQVWISNYDSLEKQMDFVNIPTFFKLKPNKKQVVQLLQTSQNLPKDRESLYWINVQEIPTKDTSTGNNLAMAMLIKVKLIFRPSNIKMERYTAENKLRVQVSDGICSLNNSTPFYFSLTNLKLNHIKLSEDITNKVSTFKPFSSVSLGKCKQKKNLLTLESIGDLGEYKNIVINQ